MSKSTLVSDFASQVSSFIPAGNSWASLEARRMVDVRDDVKDDLQAFLAAAVMLRECPSPELRAWAESLPLEVRAELSARGVSSSLLIHEWIEDLIEFYEDRDAHFVNVMAHYCASRDKLGDLLYLLDVSGGEQPYEGLKLMLEHFDFEAQHRFLPIIRHYTYDGDHHKSRLLKAHERYAGNWWAQIVV